jgi:hypothetical protein
MTVIKVKFERTFPLSNYENIKPCYEIETDIKDVKKSKEAILYLRDILLKQIEEDQKLFTIKNK